MFLFPQVKTEEGHRLAETWECVLLETSALLPVNVDESFTSLVEDIRFHENASKRSRKAQIKATSLQDCSTVSRENDECASQDYTDFLEEGIE